MQSDITADLKLRERDLREKERKEKVPRDRDLYRKKEPIGDYSFDRVPREDRKMGWVSITNITFGIATAIFYFQMGSVMALQFGAANAIISAIYAIIVAGILGSFIVYLSAKSGMNVNLLSRGGFGYIGASLTSLIYASNFIMYCAFEGMILVAAVHAYFPAIPVWVLIVVFGSLVIPLNWFGIKQLDKLQKWSLPIFFIFLITAIVFTFNRTSLFDGNFWTYMPEGVQIGGTALLLCIGMQHGIMGLTALIASDYARFLKPKDLKVGSIAIGFIPQIFCFGVMGGLGIWFGVTLGESNPGVYIVTLLGLGGVLFTVLTQVRINVTNIYSSSLSLSSFFENIFGFSCINDSYARRHCRPSRHRNDFPRGCVDELGGGFSDRCTGSQEVAENRSTLL